MKLNLHPKEFLALYNLLSVNRSAGSDEVHLQEIYNRMRACIVSALSTKGVPGSDDLIFDSWEKSQKKKINELQQKNEQIKSLATDFLTLDNSDLSELDENLQSEKKSFNHKNKSKK
jgi:hypothetical protein